MGAALLGTCWTVRWELWMHFVKGLLMVQKAVNHLFANSMQLICRVIKEKGFVEKVVGATEDARKNECESIEKDNDLS